MRRPLLASVLGCAVAGALVLLAAGRTWGAATVQANGTARQHVSVSGHVVGAALPALGLALLAMAVAMLAATGIVRRVAALLVVFLGGSAIAAAVRARGDVGPALAARVFASRATSVGGSRAQWWLLAACAGGLAVLAGALVVITGGRSGGLGSRYDAPTTTSSPTVPAVDDWDAIEQGQDPTVGR
jgi:hypothetical protein